MNSTRSNELNIGASASRYGMRMCRVLELPQILTLNSQLDNVGYL